MPNLLAWAVAPWLLTRLWRVDLEIRSWTTFLPGRNPCGPRLAPERDVLDDLVQLHPLLCESVLNHGWHCTHNYPLDDSIVLQEAEAALQSPWVNTQFTTQLVESLCPLKKCPYDVKRPASAEHIDRGVHGAQR